MRLNSPKSHSGLTLIEIMIALLIGLFIMGGIMQIFINTKQTYRMQDNLSRLQENARYALELLNHDIRMTGYLGCAGGDTTKLSVIANSPLLAPAPHTGDLAVVSASTITGGDESGGTFTTPNPALTSSPLAAVSPNTDAITIQFGESCGGYTTAAMNTVNPTALSATQTCGSKTTPGASITVGKPLVISDCAHADIFRAAADNTQNKDNAGTATTALSKTYAVGSEILLFQSYTYFIKPGSNGDPALWRFDNNYASSSSNPSEVIEGIQDLDILYGTDTDADGTANYYVASTSVPNMAQVVSVRITLTVQSIDNTLATTSGRLIRNFTSTIALRNRIF
jgi:type IV pilus assembly protein PilW